MGKGKRLKDLFKKNKISDTPMVGVMNQPSGSNLTAIKIYENNYRLYSKTDILGKTIHYSNIVILISGDIINSIDLLEFMNYKGDLRISNKIIDGILYSLIAGSICDYIEVFNTIKNYNNKILSGIRDVLYDTPKEYYKELIAHDLMVEANFIPQPDYNERYYYTSTNIDINSFDSIIIEKELEDLNIYGKNKFTLYDILPMIKINVKIKKISIKAIDELIEYVSNSYCTFKDEIEFVDINYDKEKIISVFVGDTILTDTAKNLGTALLKPYSSLGIIGVPIYDAEYYIPQGALMECDIGFTLDKLFPLFEGKLMYCKENQTILDDMKKLIFFKKEELYMKIKDCLKPQYLIDDVKNITYDDIDEIVEE